MKYFIVAIVLLLTITSPAVTIQEFVVEWLAEDSYCDVNQDGYVDYADLSLIEFEDSMTDRYVSLAGDDSDGLTIATAYNTWDKAYEDAVDDVDTIKVLAGSYLASNEIALSLFLDKPKDVTFQGRNITDTADAADGGVVFTGLDGQARTVRVFDTVALKTVTFENITIVSGSTSACISQEQDSGDETERPSVALDNCILNASVNKACVTVLDGAITTANPVSTFSAINTAFNCSGSGVHILALEFESLTIDNCTFNGSSSCITIGNTSTLGDCRNIRITNNMFNSDHAGASAWVFDGGSAISPRVDETIVQFQFTGNQIGTPLNNTHSTNGIRVAQFADLVYVDDNFIYIEKASDAQAAISLGADADTSADPLGQVICTNSTIEYTGTEAGHAILLGAGVNYAECSNNKILGKSIDASLAIGIVIKGEGNNVATNIVKMRRCIYLKGGARNKIINNTCIAMANGYAFQWLISTDSPDKNYVINNIFDGSAGLYALVISDGEGGNNYLDYNCWVAGSSGLAYDEDNTNTFADLQALQAQWLNQVNWTGLHIYTQNDANSIEADPLYVDGTDDDYRLKANSPCLNAGRPAPESGYSSIGAWQQLQGVGASGSWGKDGWSSHSK